MSLSALPPIQSLPTNSKASADFYINDPSNPASYTYAPPKGYYQNDAGQIVPMSVPNVPQPPIVQQPGYTSPAMAQDAAVVAAQQNNPGAGFMKVASKAAGLWNGWNGTTVENIVFIAVGLVLVTAGVFSFKQTQQLAVNVAKGAKTAAEVAG